MTKYRVKIYQSEELVDEQILEENDFVELADEYIYKNEYWKNVYVDTDEGEIDLDDLGLTVTLHVFFEDHDGCVQDIIDNSSDENVITDYLNFEVVQIELDTVQGIDATVMVPPEDIVLVEQQIEHDLDLDVHFQEMYIKVVVEKMDFA